jgi:hypothetical protein
MTHRALAFLALVGLAACSGEPSAPSDPLRPDLVISSPSTGGSPDFFWRPPIRNDGNGTGTFNPDLNITIKVCTTHSATVCASPVATFTNVPVVSGQYQAVWTVPVSAVVEYRIFVIAEGTPDVVVGFADVKTAANQKSLKGFDPNQFVLITDGSNLPIKFRIQGHCTNSPCNESFIDRSEGGFAYARDGSGNVLAGIHIPGGNGDGVVTVSIEPCAGGADLPVDIPLFGGCWTVNTNPEIIGANALTESGEVFICEAKEEIEGQLFSEEQEEKPTIHRHHAPDPIQALPHDQEDCDGDGDLDPAPPVVLSFKGLLRAVVNGNWHGVSRHLVSLLGPKPAYARRLDAGAGGTVFEFSNFQFGLPSKMEENFSEIGSEALTIEVYVSDLDHEPVANAKVHFATTDGSVAPLVVTTGTNGIASASWTIPEGEGVFEATAQGVGIAVPDNNGPRVGDQKKCEGDCYFDPYMAIHSPFNPTGEDETGAIAFPAVPGTVLFQAFTSSSVLSSSKVTRFVRLPAKKAPVKFGPLIPKR